MTTLWTAEEDPEERRLRSLPPRCSHIETCLSCDLARRAWIAIVCTAMLLLWWSCENYQGTQRVLRQQAEHGRRLQAGRP